MPAKSQKSSENRRGLRIIKKYFDRVISGKKDLDIRIGYPSIQRIQPGQKLWLNCNSGGTGVQVDRIAHYSSLELLLKAEKYYRIDPDASSPEELLIKGKAFFDPHLVEKYGVVVFQFSLI